MDTSQQSRESPDRSDLVSEDGKNNKSVVCQRCGSKVLCPGMAVFAEKEVRCTVLGNRLLSTGWHWRSILPKVLSKVIKQVEQCSYAGSPFFKYWMYTRQYKGSRTTIAELRTPAAVSHSYMAFLCISNAVDKKCYIANAWVLLA